MLRETGKAMSWSILYEHALASGEKFFFIDFFSQGTSRPKSQEAGGFKFSRRGESCRVLMEVFCAISLLDAP